MSAPYPFPGDNSNAYPSRLLAFGAMVAFALFSAGSGFATTRDDIGRAVTANGGASVESATSAQFVMAFTSVAVRRKELTLTENVIAGINLRTDLAPQITVAALRLQRSRQDFKDEPDSCQWIGSIVRSAVTAAPSAKAAIVHAALDAEPASRECIFAAAGMQDGETGTAFFRPSGVDAGSINSSAIGTINPGNFAGQGGIISPFRP